MDHTTPVAYIPERYTEAEIKAQTLAIVRAINAQFPKLFEEPEIPLEELDN